MCWLTTEKITVDLNVSDDVKGLANGLFEKYAKVLIGDADEAYLNPYDQTCCVYNTIFYKD